MRHEWVVDVDRAHEIQRALASHAILRPLPREGAGAPRYAAGVDVGYSRDGECAWAAAIVMDKSLRVIDRVVVPGRPDRSYAPGLLAFREGRLTIEALTSLTVEPDLIFCDGHGIVHERGCGLATHVGVLLDVPTIGVPKTPFHSIERSPGLHRGDYYVLTKEWGAEGAALRLRTGTKPVYVSPGHLVDLPSAIELCLEWSTGKHRVPEPLQAADTESKLARGRF